MRQPPSPAPLTTWEEALSKLPEYEIYAIRYAKQDERPEAHMFLGGDPRKLIQGLDFFTYALRGAGRTWIVDTGMTEVQAKRMGRHYDFILRPREALAKIGIEATSEPDVILTHAHFDHVGTVADYAKARFHIQDAEMLHVTGRDMTHAPFRAAYHAEDIKVLIDLVFQDRMVFHNGDVTLAPGIEFLLLGGHARGQAVVRVNTARGWVVLASDAVHVFEEVDQERPFAIFYDLPGMLEGYRRIKGLAGTRDLIIPGHDHRVTLAYPAAAAGLDGRVVRLDKPPSWPPSWPPAR
ncbi:MAG TPA: N-acyl homoserine lactonase family protein [Hyphomicrobiaceae bacterium]|jgi:glyoxylase-like metal-dependent hydrolase (beta-lactamase superfamily II)|nr:N-acyl homoserine lactonase family protein [Hyphomicrobiaceae bacterium]